MKNFSMKIWFLLCGVIFLNFSALVWADYLQVLPAGRPDGEPNTSATSYNAILHRSHSFRTTNDYSKSIIPTDGVLSDICFYFTVAPGSGKSWTITLMKNNADVSGANVTIADSATEGCISAAEAVSSGDSVTLKFVPSGTPAATGVTYVSYLRPSNPLSSIYTFVWTGNSAGKVWGGSANIGLHGVTNQTTAENYDYAHVIPKDCTIDRLFIQLTDAPGNTRTRTFTLYKNGVATALTCSISNTNTTCSDTTNAVSFSAGDIAYIHHPTTTVNAASYIMGGVSISTGFEGEFFLMANQYDLSATDTMYGSVHSDNMSYSATESGRWHQVYQMTVTGMEVSLDTAPGSGKSFTFTLRNDGADGNNTCTIADSETTCSVNAEDFVLSGSTLGIKAVPSGTPTVSSRLRISLVGFKTPIRRW